MCSRNAIAKTLLVALAGFALATAQPALVHASTWKYLSTTTSPTVRELAAMTYDPVSKTIVLFGGLGVNGDLNDTWEFDGTNWNQIETTGAPTPRNGATMTYDRGSNKLVLFGGFDVDQYLHDTWVFDGATSTWTEVNMPAPPPKATGAMLFTDPITGRAMMFGGYNATQVIPVYNNTWRWSGQSWIKMNPATAPFPKAWGMIASDPLRRNVVLTGGTGDTIRADNTWTWDGTNWTMQSPATQIPAYLGAGAIFDPAMKVVVVVGALGDTWSWTGNNWVQLTPTLSPIPRSYIGMAYDFLTQQTIIFGGQLSNGNLVNGTFQLMGPQ